jgi:hypothetical protein
MVRWRRSSREVSTRIPRDSPSPVRAWRASAGTGMASTCGCGHGEHVRVREWGARAGAGADAGWGAERRSVCGCNFYGSPSTTPEIPIYIAHGYRSPSVNSAQRGMGSAGNVGMACNRRYRSVLACTDRYCPPKACSGGADFGAGNQRYRSVLAGTARYCPSKSV